MSKKAITLTLYVSELIYDVQNKTYLTGQSRRDGKNHEQVANMQVNDDDENASQVLRSIQNAYGVLKTKLGEWIDEDGTTATNELIENNSITYHQASVSDGKVTWKELTADKATESPIAGTVASVADLPTEGVTGSAVYMVSPIIKVTLSMPSNYNNSTRETICTAMHQYIVNTAIADWFVITDKADAQDYYTMADNNLESIREAANKRIRPTRTKI